MVATEGKEGHFQQRNKEFDVCKNINYKGCRFGEAARVMKTWTEHIERDYSSALICNSVYSSLNIEYS